MKKTIKLLVSLIITMFGLCMFLLFGYLFIRSFNLTVPSLCIQVGTFICSATSFLGVTLGFYEIILIKKGKD